MLRALYPTVKGISMKNVEPYIATLWKWTLAIVLMLVVTVHAIAAEPRDTSDANDALLGQQHSSTKEALSQKIAWGDEVKTKAAKEEPQESLNIVGAMTQMFMGLMFVIGLMLAVAWCYRRWGRRIVHNQMGRQHMELIESMSIGVKRQVSLVRVADQVFILGQGEHEIATLGTITLAALNEHAGEETVPSEDDTQIMDTEDPQRPATLQVFKQKLADILQKPS